MNFWDLTKSPPKGSREVFARKKYGQKFFKKFIRTHDYYFVELPDKKEKFLPMGYFFLQRNCRYGCIHFEELPVRI